MTKPSKTIAIERLRKILQRIPALEPLSEETPEFTRWRRDARLAVGNIFGCESSNVRDLAEVRYSPIVYTSGDLGRSFQRAYQRGLKTVDAILRSMIDEIVDYWPDEHAPPVSNADTVVQPGTNEVFVVHGRDQGSKETVARLVTKLGLQPVVLHEQPN